MGTDPSNDPIVRTWTSWGAPTGEAVRYVTESGREWRSDPSGEVVSGTDRGTLSGGGKFGPTTITPSGWRR